MFIARLQKHAPLRLKEPAKREAVPVEERPIEIIGCGRIRLSAGHEDKETASAMQQMRFLGRPASVNSQTKVDDETVYFERLLEPAEAGGSETTDEVHDAA